MSRSRLDEVLKFKPFRCRHTACSVIDMIVCANECLIVVGRINGEVSIVDACSCKEIKRLNVCTNENARLEKIQIDIGTSLILSACTDRTISVFSLANGMLLAGIHGHAKSVSGLKFSHNLKFVISTSKDGCLFIWGVPTKVLKIGAKITQSGDVPWANKQARDSTSETLMNQKNAAIQLPDLEISKKHSPLTYINTVKKNMQRVVTVESGKAPPMLAKNEDDDESEGFVEEFSLLEDSCRERIDEQHKKGLFRRPPRTTCTSDTRLIQSNQAKVKINRSSATTQNREYPMSCEVGQRMLSAPVITDMLQQAYEAGDRDPLVKSFISPVRDCEISPLPEESVEENSERMTPNEEIFPNNVESVPANAECVKGLSE